MPNIVENDEIFPLLNNPYLPICFEIIIGQITTKVNSS